MKNWKGSIYIYTYAITGYFFYGIRILLISVDDETGKKFSWWKISCYTVTVYSFVPIQLGHSGWTHVFNINVTHRTWGEAALHVVYILHKAHNSLTTVETSCMCMDLVSRGSLGIRTTHCLIGARILEWTRIDWVGNSKNFQPQLRSAIE